MPFHDAFAPSAEAVVFGNEHNYVALMLVEALPGRRALVPLEAAWGLASPLIGPEPGRTVLLLSEALTHGKLGWHLLALSGIAEHSDAFGALVSTFGHRYRIAIGESASRCVADLQGGFEAFLARRSARFRASLRRAIRHADSRGVVYERIEHVDDPDIVFARIVAIEARSWKGDCDCGIDSNPGREFYLLMIRRLARRGAFRAVFVRQGGHDIAYVFGGVRGDTYRGLQLSFVDDARDLAAGNLAQAAMIRWLCEDGAIRYYDLGTDMPYKRRWAMPGLTTSTVLLFRG